MESHGASDIKKLHMENSSIGNAEPNLENTM